MEKDRCNQKIFNDVWELILCIAIFSDQIGSKWYSGNGVSEYSQVWVVKFTGMETFKSNIIVTVLTITIFECDGKAGHWKNKPSLQFLSTLKIDESVGYIRRLN